MRARTAAGRETKTSEISSPRELAFGSYAKLLAFVTPVLLVGFAIAMAKPPGQRCAGLNKSSVNPPNFVFGPAWSIMYVLIAGRWLAYLGSRKGNPRKSTLGRSDGAQLRLVALFFTVHSLGGALFVIVALLIAMVLFIAPQ